METTLAKLVKKRRRWPIVAVVLMLMGLWFGYWEFRSASIRASDLRMVAESENEVISQLSALPASDFLIQRLGTFQSYTRNDWMRPRYMGQLTFRVFATGTVQFANGSMPIEISIENTGPLE